MSESGDRYRWTLRHDLPNIFLIYLPCSANFTTAYFLFVPVVNSIGDYSLYGITVVIYFWPLLYPGKGNRSRTPRYSV